MRYLQFLLACILMYSCSAPNSKDTSMVTTETDTIANDTEQPETGEQPETSNDFLVIPDERVGKTTIGITTDSLAMLLGTPDQSDAAMGKAWLTWWGKRDEHNNRTRLDIYTTYKDSSMKDKTVQQIHTTSSSFRTADGLHVYSDMADVRRSFPNLKKVAHYTTEGRHIFIYDEQSRGIAFEQVKAGNEELCIGIVVHRRGAPVTETYIYLQPNVELINE